MEQRKQSTKRAAIAAAIAGMLAVGVGAYFAGMLPAESEVLPAAGKLAPASVPAPAGAATAGAAAPGASTSAAASMQAAHHQRSKEAAAAALMALPELQAWSALLEKNSGGKAHGALIEYDPAPRTIHGKSYWQFSFVENSEEAALRWESFLASSSDDEILVEDASTDEVMSLARWRKEKQPAKRTGIDG